MMVSDDRFASFERKWLDSAPQNAFILVFVPASLRQTASAFGTLVHELRQAAFQVREPQVAVAKLQWWRDELDNAHAGRARHPVTIVLFQDGRLRESDPSLWPRLAEAALGQIESGPAPQLNDLIERQRGWNLALVTAQSFALGTAGKNPRRDADLLSISHLLHDFADPELPVERLALPLNLLARFGLTHDTAKAASANAGQFARAYLDALGAELDRCLRQGAGESLPVRVGARLDFSLIARARRASNPAECLGRYRRASRWRCLRVCWREARALAQAP